MPVLSSIVRDKLLVFLLFAVIYSAIPRHFQTVLVAALAGFVHAVVFVFAGCLLIALIFLICIFYILSQMGPML